MLKKKLLNLGWCWGPISWTFFLAVIWFFKGQYGLAATLVLIQASLLKRSRWLYFSWPILLLASSLGLGLTHGLWMPLLGSLFIISLFSLCKAHFNQEQKQTWTSFSIALGTAILLAIVHLKVKLPMLLLERFFPTWGWFNIALLAGYGAWIGPKLLNDKTQAKWRGKIWMTFSMVFFAQLILGLLGFEKFLQTGKLHLPIPALIVGGPLFRGYGFFMPILLLSTILLAGPTWCSHLCYIGAWDHWAASRVKRPSAMPPWRAKARLGILMLVIIVAWMLRILDAPMSLAVGIAVFFGLLGVGIMLFWSRKKGVMVHCTAFCPIGWITTRLGKLNPFRLKLNQDKCTRCLICTRTCRYDAIRPIDVDRGHIRPSCTLCGDCVSSCHTHALEYHLFNLSPERSRQVFVIVVSILHAVFLGLARI